MKLLKHLLLFLIVIYQAYASDNPRELFKFAKFKFDKAEYDEALTFLNQSISADSTYSSAYLLRGEIYYKIEKYEMAISDFKKAFSIDTAYSSFLNKYFILEGKAYIHLNDR